ncbi:MAG: FAD-binding oxidoreductase [bacterium]|nr:FAD-binding oxidoreductase [bacterium]
MTKLNIDITEYFYFDEQMRERYSKDAVYQGTPSCVYRAGDWETVTEVIAHCNAKQTPITFCGSQTSMTGSSVADEGLALSLSLKNKILDIGKDTKTGTPFVITEPGVVLADLKKAVQEQGYFYPPDPTSYKEALVGSTVATNATGEGSFKYGPTRKYVQELEVVLPNGTIKTLVRQKNVPVLILKNTAGYCHEGEEIDEIIGSEGTLAMIKKIKLNLLEDINPHVFVLVLPFSNFEKSIQAVSLLLKKETKAVAIELIGPGAADYFKRCSVCPEELKEERSFLYIKEEYATEAGFKQKTDEWFRILTEVYRQVGDHEALDRVFLAQTNKQLRDIHECRHYIPLMVNEEYFPSIQHGGGKIGTDWWVPTRHLYDIMTRVYKKALEIKIPFVVFGHIGDGHPHWNFLTKNAEENHKAKLFVKSQYEKVVLCGGGVAGEHGLGKIKKDLLAIQHPSNVIRKMLTIKNKWDSNWIFGRGNVFDYSKK